jgi:Mannitol-1-phosphate/altronate dehydrogenases
MNKTAVIYGAGNIGRGFTAQLFNLSSYDIVFIDVDERIVTAMNEYHEYPIYITNGDDYKKMTITNVSAVNGRDIEAVARTIQNADIMATAIGVNILPYIIKPVAEGLKLRKSPLDIILCENKIDADTYFGDMIAAEVDVTDVSFIRTSVGCMVPVVPDKIRALHPLAIAVENYRTLYVDGSGFKNGVPEITNMKAIDPFEICIQQKLYMHNMSHAATAYLGSKYEYIYEAIRDTEVKSVVIGALAESAAAIKCEHNVDMKPYADELIKRYDNKLLGDTTERVGRDTKRKLSRDDRIVGALHLCVKHGIEPVNIIRALLAGIEFEKDGEIHDHYVKYGLRDTLIKYCGITDENIINKIDRLSK